MKKTVLVRGPAYTRSGYGEQCRFALRALASYPHLFDVYLAPISWGKTCWITTQNTDERMWLDSLTRKAISWQKENRGPFDISVQVTIPNEWELMAHKNVGYTAGIETTLISPSWLEPSNKMDRIIVVSNHSKNVFETTEFQAVDQMTRQPTGIVKVTTPIEVVHFPARNVTPATLELKFATDFNFLCVAQAGVRKNLKKTVQWFVEKYKDNPNVGLIVKAFMLNQSTMDKNQLELQIKSWVEEHAGYKCKLYFIHGAMTDEEMYGLYYHPQIKAFLTTTHGEGFGLPIFEAACAAMPIIAPDWSGHVDFLYSRVKKKNGKIRNRAMFAKLDYSLERVQSEAVWPGVIEQEAMWCYTNKNSFFSKLDDVLKDYSRYKSQAKQLAVTIREEYSEENQYEEFVEAVLGESVETGESDFEQVMVL